MGMAFLFMLQFLPFYNAGARLSAYLSIYLSIYPSIYLSIYPSTLGAASPRLCADSLDIIIAFFVPPARFARFLCVFACRNT